MARAYLFIYGPTFGDRNAVKKVLNQIPEITLWRYDLPNTYYLISDLLADELHERIVAVAVCVFVAVCNRANASRAISIS
jgi:hypothetical protein